MLNSIKTIGKYLDQPLLVGKFSKVVPATLLGGSALYTLHETHKAKKGEKIKTAINTGLVLSATSVAALVAPKIATKAIGRAYEKVDINKIVRANREIIKEYTENNQVSENISKILNKAKTNVLKPKEIKILHTEMSKTDAGKKLINKLVPEPENVTASDIVKDMGRLSILGFLPVAGGIAGGVAGDLITDKPNWKNKFPNKIKEGAYQYLANIFLCNVGAAAALGIMEAAKVTSKSARALGMVGGIIATGVVGGSAIANYISKKVINPLFDKGKQKNVEQEKSLYSDRKPEMLDVCLHTDDVATIAVMSGFKWIEPSLPILYAISGYRAGIGYRNGNGTSNQTIPHEHKHEFCRQNKKK